MDKELSIKGYWFLPDNKENRVAGTLTFKQDEGIELELLGSLTPFEGFKKQKTIDCILGFSVKGEKITLVRCGEFSRTIHYPGIEVSWFTSEFLLIGDHFENESEMYFHKITSEFKYLKEWMQSYIIEKVSIGINKTNPSITFSRQPHIVFSINENLVGRFRNEFSIPGHKFHFDVNINNKVIFEIEASEAISISDAFNLLLLFQDFLTLGAFDASYPLSIVLQNNKRTNMAGKREYPREVYVFYKLKHQKQTNKSSPNDFLFHYDDIKPYFETIFKTWYTNASIIRPISNNLLGTFYRQANYVEDSFINVVQSLESFHRRFRKNTHFEKSEHSKLIKRVINSEEEKYRKWLKDKLSFNEPTLQTRLESLLEEFSNTTLTSIIPEKLQFIKETKDSRNYYTHFDNHLEKKALKGGKLMNQTEKLRILLIMVVLNEVGFPKELIEKLFSKVEYRRFNHLVR